jgi:hypothetical protein
MVDSVYHTRIVTVTTGDGGLKELDEYLAEQAGKKYELHSLTELATRVQDGGNRIEKLLVVTKHKDA